RISRLPRRSRSAAKAGGSRIGGRKTQNIRRLVRAAVPLVEGTDAGVGDDGDGEFTAGAGGGNPGQPGGETGRADGTAPVVRDGDAEPRATTGFHRTLRTPSRSAARGGGAPHPCRRNARTRCRRHSRRPSSPRPGRRSGRPAG